MYEGHRQNLEQSFYFYLCCGTFQGLHCVQLETGRRVGYGLPERKAVVPHHAVKREKTEEEKKTISLKIEGLGELMCLSWHFLVAVLK